MLTLELETRKHPCFICGRDLDEGLILWDKTNMEDIKIKSTIIKDNTGKMIHGKTVLCPCGLAQEFEPMTAAALDIFYKKPDIGESPYRQLYPVPPGATRHPMRNNIEFIFSYIPVIQKKMIKILVVGSGDLEPLNMLKELIPNSVVNTFEPGLPKSEINFQEKPNQQYDLILCNNVLEHVYNPVKFLENLRSLFHEDTCMILSVPDLLTLNLTMGKDQWFSNAHIYHFNVDSLAYTIGLAGFNIFSNCIREEEMGSKIYVGFKIKKWMTLNQLIPLSTKTLEDIKDIIVTGNELYYKREALLRERYEQLRESDRREENRCQD